MTTPLPFNPHDAPKGYKAVPTNALNPISCDDCAFLHTGRCGLRAHLVQTGEIESLCLGACRADRTWVVFKKIQ